MWPKWRADCWTGRRKFGQVQRLGVIRGLARGALLGEGEMHILAALGAVAVGAAVLVPVHREPRAQDSRFDEGAHVQAHAVVQVRLAGAGPDPWCSAEARTRISAGTPVA